MSVQQEDVSDYERPFYHDGIKIGGFTVSQDGLWGGLAVLPVLFLYLLIAVVPILFAFYVSFHDVPATKPAYEFIGLQNYSEVLSTDRFWAALWRGVVFMIGSTVIQTTVGIWMALIVNNISRGERALSTLIFTAYLTPTVIVSLLATFMLDTQVGVLHQWGASLGLWDGRLLGDPDLAMWALVAISSWKFSVFVTLFTLAQLRSIPERFYEAAKVCGATTWEMFRDITLQRIKGVLLIAILLRSIFMFNKFDIIMQLTGGGPGKATETLPIYAYEVLVTASRYGLANTIAIVMFAFLAAGAIGYFIAFNPSQEADV